MSDEDIATLRLELDEAKTELVTWRERAHKAEAELEHSVALHAQSMGAGDRLQARNDWLEDELDRHKDYFSPKQLHILLAIERDQVLPEYTD